VKQHLVLMAKAAALGRVKTRLAREIGALAALRFHRLTAERLIRRLGRDRRWRLLVATTPGPRFRATLIPQGHGDLGARMRRPLEQLPPGPVVIVGADIPGVTVAHVADAFRALGTHDLVLGPATDGGYWLVGAKRRPLPPGLFRRVRWSSEHALADTLAGVPARFSVAFVAVLEDVDDAAALRRASDAPAAVA
jgi:rSAM/selenodomain-associated transferase 1